MDRLPTRVYSTAQIKQIERTAIEREGIASFELMRRAGIAALQILKDRWPEARSVVVLCGAGNNAGDGYVVAQLAMALGLQATVIALGDPGLLRGDAQRAHSEFVGVGGRTQSWESASISKADIVVDALLGTGLSRPLSPEWQECIKFVNAARIPILSIDVPSGLNADTGNIESVCVVADCTVTFVGLKQGFFLGVAADYIGDLLFDPLGTERDAERSAFAAERLDAAWLKSVLPKRSKVAHKGTNGRVLIVGGGEGMAGAVRLAGEACLRVGAGIVTVGTHPKNVTAVVSERPELIVRAIDAQASLRLLIEQADVIAIGPGLGQDEWAQSLFDAVISVDKPHVVDADALNLLAQSPKSSKSDHWILTPHPGEASRLLSSSTSAVQSDRLGSAKELASRYGGITVLKGSNTLIAAEQRVPAICAQGNKAMATAGMGDVLTGVIAGICAQMVNQNGAGPDLLWLAARVGVVAHAFAGDLAVQALGNIERGLIASDLFRFLPEAVTSNE